MNMVKKLACGVGFAAVALGAASAWADEAQAGLWQKKVSGWSTDADPSDGGTLVPGALLASCAAASYTYGVTTYTMGDNQTWAYSGYMYLEGGVTYNFVKNYDDNGCIIITDPETGEPTTVVSSTTYGEEKYGTYTPAENGYYPIYLAVGNGSGGKGPTKAPFNNASQLGAGLAWTDDPTATTCTTSNYDKWHKFLNEDGEDPIFYVTPPAVTDLSILPIPDQVNETFEPCCPELVVSNRTSGATWTVGGGIASQLFDVAYTNNYGVGTAKAIVTGKGEYEGQTIRKEFTITATKLEDEIISTTDLAARRLTVDGMSVYVFTDPASAHTVTPKADLFIADCLLVGGGGGGGRTMAGGGGGGGVNATGAVGTFVSVSNAFTVVVGAGGAGSTASNVKGGNGGDTSLGFGSFAVTANGGGGGGSWDNRPGANGGSGGGGCREGAGGLGITGLGFAGAAGAQASTAKAGGGGGAGHAGYQYTTEDGTHTGNGGEGVSNRITGAWVVYGGGGGAGGSSNGYGTPDPGIGGIGGGGAGGKTNLGENGTDGLGGGGGGGGYASSGSFYGGNGGSGVAILALVPVDFKADAIPAQYVKSGGCTPEPVVRCGDTLLVKDTDYTLAYADNTAPGIAKITITGIGTYAGKVGYAAFEILNRYCVKPTVAAEGDGSSWANAMSWTNALAVAVASLEANVEIWLSGDITLDAAPATIALTRPTVIRGGFAGTEDSPDERVAGAKSTFDGQGTNTVMTIANGTGTPVVLEGLRISHGPKGIVKSGAGDISILNCVIVGNFLTSGGPNGTGLSLVGTAAAKLVVSNCVISGNGCGPTMITNLGSGQGLYVSDFGSAVIEDSTFLTNGIAWTGRDLWNEGRDGQAGAAIYLNNVPATVRRCVFRGNRGNCNSNRGGIVRIAGTSGGTLFDHCVFAGNEEDHHNFAGVPSGGKNGGQIAINLSAETDRVTIQNCTMGGNFSDNTVSAAGVTVTKGTVAIKNSVIANNIVHPTNTGGADLALVDPTAHAEVSYSVLSADGSSSYSSVNVDNLSFGAGMRFGDPRLVSSADDVEGLLVQIPGSSSAQNLRQFDKTKLDEVLGIDVHALSPAGYFTNDGVEHVSGGDYSRAIDAGDPLDPVGAEPSPNGGVENAGAYGGTAQASKTAEGVPAVDGAVTVTFDGEYSQPTVHFTVGGTGAFYAQAQVYISTNNVDWVLMDTISGLAKGTAEDVLILAYYAPGSVWAKVMLTAGGHEATATSVETPVTKPLPPWTGKGGPANVIHVRPGAIGAGTGENWSDAVPNLRSAFSLVSASKNEIWIAGTNVLAAGSITLNAANPLSVKGGFHGWENSAAEREPGFRSVIDGVEVTDCLTIANSASVSIERIYFTRSLNCGLIKTGAGDMLVSDCHFITNGMGRATDPSGKGARVSGTAATTVVTFADCVFRGNRAKPGTDGGCAAYGAGICASKLKCIRLEGCTFVHNGIHLRAPGGGSSYEPSSGSSFGSAVYSTSPVSAVGCRFIANFGNVRNTESKDAGYGGVVRLQSGAEDSAFTNCAWVANGDEIVWQGYGTGGKNIAGALTVQFDSASCTVDVQNCTFAYNLADGYETTAGINIVLGTVNVRDSIFYGNILGGTSKTRGKDISLRGESVCNVYYTLFGESGSNSVTCAETARTNFHAGVVFGNPLFVTEYAAMTNLVKESSTASATGAKLIFWDWTSATAPATYAALEAANVHLRGGLGYHDEATGSLVTTYSRGEKSPCIDKGDPDSEYHREPAGYNGRRVNMGYYGNSPWATMSQPAGSVYYLR